LAKVNKFDKQNVFARLCILHLTIDKLITVGLLTVF